MNLQYGSRKPPVGVAHNGLIHLGTHLEYPFNEGGGSKVHDSIGDQSMSLTTGASWTTGVGGYGVQFNGTSRLISSPLTDFGMKALTWIVVAQEAGSGVRALMAQNDDGYSTDGETKLNLFYLNSGVLTFGYRNANVAGFQTVSAGSGLNDGKVHIFTARRGYPWPNAALFVDGVKTADTASGQTSATTNFTGSSHTIGMGWNGNAGWSWGMSGIVYYARVIYWAMPDSFITEAHERLFDYYQTTRRFFTLPVQDTRTRRRVGVMTL